MPHYRVHRIQGNAKENFRWAPHTGGLAMVKPKDYEPGEEMEAGNPYEAWQRMAEQGRALHPGDLLETYIRSSNGDESGAGDLRIAKYIGFEPAQWFVPETKPLPEIAHGFEFENDQVSKILS